MKSLEHDEQVAVFQWAAYQQSRNPELWLLHAVPNGGKRHISVAMALKAEGVKPGVPDICLPVARRGYHALFIELKAGNNKATPEQLEWIDRLGTENNFAKVVTGASNAIGLIEWYLGIGEEK